MTEPFGYSKRLLLGTCTTDCGVMVSSVGMIEFFSDSANFRVAKPSASGKRRQKAFILCSAIQLLPVPAPLLITRVRLVSFHGANCHGSGSKRRGSVTG